MADEQNMFALLKTSQIRYQLLEVAVWLQVELLDTCLGAERGSDDVDSLARACKRAGQKYVERNIER
jgi:hypothetical protein